MREYMPKDANPMKHTCGDRLALTEDLASKEIIFKAPPLTPELISAIKLIGPHMNLQADEISRMHWEKDQNGACWAEYEVLEPVLKELTFPERILEIGPGLGRSVVFFQKKLGWPDNNIHIFEGNGSATKYTLLGPRFDDSFCGTIPLLEDVLRFNGLESVQIFDAAENSLSSLPGPYDLIYSFYSIGFHWSIEYFLDDLTHLLKPGGLAIFTVPSQFQLSGTFQGFDASLLTQRAVWPKNSWLKLLLLTRT